MRLTSIYLALTLLLTGCGLYRMPTDDDLCAVPTTNNPQIVRDAGDTPMPGAGF